MNLIKSYSQFINEAVSLRTPPKEELVGKRVMVYYNLHTHTFSVRLNERVVLHTDYIRLENVEFRVRPGGRDKVRQQQSKNVHAFVIGNIVDYTLPGEEIPNPSTDNQATYNPYKYESFVKKDTDEPIFKAKVVEMIKRKVYLISESLSDIILESKIGDLIENKWMIIDIIDTDDNLGDILDNDIDNSQMELGTHYEKYIEYIVYGVDDNKFYLLDPSYEVSVGPCNSLDELYDI